MQIYPNCLKPVIKPHIVDRNEDKMAALADFMPAISIDETSLKSWGEAWLSDVNSQTRAAKSPNAFDKKQSVNFASFIDLAFGQALSQMLGGIPIERPVHNSLLPPKPDCVEVGSVRIVGGIRPQNYDAAYRPDGPRVVFDSKTLNDLKSVGKNWQNMINDLATEAATAHTRFPYAVVTFMFIVPRLALADRQATDIIRTLERLGTRRDVLDQAHLAEAISVVVWEPATGFICDDIPVQDSNLRIEQFSNILFPHYLERYKGLPPHAV